MPAADLLDLGQCCATPSVDPLPRRCRQRRTCIDAHASLSRSELWRSARASQARNCVHFATLLRRRSSVPLPV